MKLIVYADLNLKMDEFFHCNVPLGRYIWMVPPVPQNWGNGPCDQELMDDENLQCLSTLFPVALR